MTEKKGTPPSEETISAVLAQLENIESRRKALAFAKQRCATLRKMGIDADHNDLVQEAISDTLSGDLSWRPDACALSTHLIGVIRNRTHKLRTRRREFLNRAEQPDGPTAHPEARLEAADVWARIRDALFARATDMGDEEVSYVLMAFDDGIHKTTAVCEQTQLTASQVKNAKRRIWRLIAELEPDMVDAAKQIGAGA